MRHRTILWILPLVLLAGCRAAPVPQPADWVATHTPASVETFPDAVATVVPRQPNGLENSPQLAITLEPLSVSNAPRMAPIARIGEGTFGDHLAVSPTGSLIAVTTAGGIVFVDSDTGQRMAFLPTSSNVDSLAFSPDGQQLITVHREPGKELIAAGELAGQPVYNPVFTRYDLGTHQAHSAFNQFRGDCGEYAAWDLTFSPDGTMLVFRDQYSLIGHARADHLCVLSARDGAFIRAIPIEPPWRSASPALFSKDGQQLILGVVDSSTEGSSTPTTRIRFYEFRTGEFLREIDGSGMLHDLALSPDGSTLAVADQRGARLLSVLDGSLIAQYGEHDREIFSVSFSPDGTTLALGSLDSTVSAWSLMDGRLLWRTTAWVPYSPWDTDGMLGEIWNLAFSPDSATLFALAPTHLMDTAGQVRALQVSNGQELFHVDGYSTYSQPGLSPDKTRLVFGGYADGLLQVWSVVENQPIDYLQGHTGLVTSVIFSPDGQQIASASLDGTVRLWNAADGSPRLVLTGHSGPVRAVQFSPDGEQLASLGDDATLRLWNVRDGQPRKSLNTQTGNWLANAITFSMDGQKVILAYGCPYVHLCQASGAGDLRQVDLTTGQVQTLIPYSVYTIAFSNHHTSFAITGAQLTQSGQMHSEQYVAQRTYQSPLGNGNLDGAAISPDGQLFFSGNAFGLHVWNLADGAMVALCMGTSLPFGKMQVTPDQKILTVASPDGLVTLWGVPSSP